ncbi:MAG: helix-hairpin-helix domain-containing protein [Candidatus Micrarchaeota archaeon]|nr:helix-hairpin-helix domain-containing protein [Candidatus Micrarchaeota archaeon]
MPGEKKQPRVVVDKREPDEVCDALEALGAEIELKQLELGDYQASDRLIIERKTRADFEASIIDGRLFSQVSDLSGAMQRVVVIVEGDPPNTADSRLSKAALLGAYSSIISDFGCTLFFTRSPSATAELVYALAAHEQIAKKQSLSVYAKRKSITIGQKQRAIVEAMPNVGPTLARALLEYFNTVENVMSAPESELKEVAKLGQKRAKELRELLSTRYKEEK